MGQVLAALRSLDGCRFDRMSGSGATCFGVFAAAEEARVGAATLAAAHPDWWVAAAVVDGGADPATS